MAFLKARDLSSHNSDAGAGYKLHVALRCLSFLYLTRLVAHQNAAFLQCLGHWGPLETRHGKREFSGISYGGGGEFFDF